MKKILLYLLLLMSLNFYSQPANEVHCAGDTTFNLTYRTNSLIGNLNPAETTVSYHLTLQDASNGVNAISNPANFIVPQTQGNLVTQTIYARINHLGEITTSNFSLTVAALFLTAAMIEPIDCEKKGTIRVQVLGGQPPFICGINNTYYSTSDPNSPSFSYFPTGNMSTVTFSNLAAGNYNILLRDANGCMAPGSWAIETSSIIPLNTPTATVENVTCNGMGNGVITVNATGGNSPLQYSINDGPFTLNNKFTNLAPGNYTIFVKDFSSGCTKVISASVTEPVLLKMTAAITKPIDCISNATVTLNATGGTSPYLYSKDGHTFSAMNVFNDLIAGTYTIFVKDNYGCSVENAITITPVVPVIATITKTDVQCNGINNGLIAINALGGKSPYTYSLENNIGIPISNQPTNIFSGLSTGSYRVKVADANGCVISLMADILEPTALYTIVTVKNQTITINATGGSGNYKYAISPDLDKFSTNNVFSGLTPDSYNVITQDVNGCYVLMGEVTVDPPAPLINGLGKLILQFKAGQTLADLIVTGQDIKWYIHKYLLTGKTSRTSETPLPLSTVLVDGTTYYASQTVNGIESTERLEVTVKSNALGNDDFVIKDFTYYPNPVKNVLTISNSSVIDEVTLTSIKGEMLLTKQIKSLHSEIDLSNLSKGVYFLKVKAEGTEKTVKLIKE
jgi:hypothetical protein